MHSRPPAPSRLNEEATHYYIQSLFSKFSIRFGWEREREIQIWSTDWGGKNDAPERPAQIIASILLIQSLLWVLLTGLLQKHSKSSLFIKFSRHLCYNEHIPTHLYGFSRHLKDFHATGFDNWLTSGCSNSYSCQNIFSYWMALLEGWGRGMAQIIASSIGFRVMTWTADG